jgi:hypothetical protein
MVEQLLVERLSTDSSYMVLSSCLSNLQELNPELAFEKARSLENENSSTMLAGVAQIYGSLGNAEEFKFFQSIFLQGKVIGFDEVGAMNAFTFFVMRNVYDVLQESIDIFTHLKNNGAFYTKLFLPQNVNYILSALDEQLIELEEEKTALQKTGNTTSTDQLNKQIDFLILMKSKYNKLLD